MTAFSNLDDVARQARRLALTMIYHAGSGHPGGSLSVTDLLVWLYTQQLRIRPDDPSWPGRDRLILSKGHACPALYAVAHLAQLQPRPHLASFRKINGQLQGHPHVGTTPWAETSTGSLGQGFSAGLGMALGLRFQGIEASVYPILGDGEVQEGEIWEGAMFAAHHRLNRVCAVLDYNKMQSDDTNANIMGLEPLAEKWRAFGWSVIETDGHDWTALAKAFSGFPHPEKPTLILAHTVKGKGISYMEGVPAWHGSVKLTDDNLNTALRELGVPESELAAWRNGSIWEVLA